MLDYWEDTSELPALIYAAHLGLEQLSMTSDVAHVATMLHLIELIAATSPE